MRSCEIIDEKRLIYKKIRGEERRGEVIKILDWIVVCILDFYASFPLLPFFLPSFYFE